MYEVGVFPGKFFPPHRGHLNAIIQAATKVDLLYVVVSDNMDIADALCKKNSLLRMPLKLRAKWLSVELQNIEHIKVIILDEAGIPPYPEGCAPWAKRLREVMPVQFDIIFGGEAEYGGTYMVSFPDVLYQVYDYTRSRYPVSATDIRNDYLKHWDYILGSAREFFARRVLISGTESCGKTVITKYLAKIFHTSWSEEWGRHYPDKYLGGNDKLLEPDDFVKIAHEQAMIDEDTLRCANRISFFDTDAVVTQFYCNMYTGKYNPDIDRFIDPGKYDVILLLSPATKWVADGMRWKSYTSERQQLHTELRDMYVKYHFDRMIYIDENSYNSRLNAVVDIADRMLADRSYMSR